MLQKAWQAEEVQLTPFKNTPFFASSPPPPLGITKIRESELPPLPIVLHNMFHDDKEVDNTP